MAVTRFGNEILVNTLTSGTQRLSTMVPLENGNLVIVWVSSFNTSDYRAQILSPTGAAVGDEIVLGTAASTSPPSIAPLADGGFAATWTVVSTGPGFDTEIVGQVFGADGAAPVGPFIVNTVTADIQIDPQTTALANGNFVVIWRTQDAATGSFDVAAQIFDADGVPVGEQLPVNTVVSGEQLNSRIVALSNGGFAIVWTDTSGIGGDASVPGIKARVYSPQGAPVGDELLVNTATENFQDQASIAALPGGGFVVAWRDGSQGVGGAGGDSSSAAIKAQVFSNSGATVGNELLVNTATQSLQNVPVVTALASGFVVVWEDSSQGVGGAPGDTSGTAIKAQVFLANGSPNGTEILVNTATASEQRAHSVTALSSGGFVVVWEDVSFGVGGATGDTSLAIKAQVFLGDGTRDGGEILVNTAVDGVQEFPIVVALDTGGFVVTWTDGSQGVGGATGDTSEEAIKAQVFQVTTGNPTPLEISINDVTVTEGDAGTAQATFNLALSGVPLAPVQVQFATVDGTATGGSDYLSASGPVTFAAGETTKTITVDVSGDIVFEGDETFSVELSNATGAVIGDGQGIATIVDDDISVSLVNVIGTIPLSAREQTITIDGIGGYYRVADIVLTGGGPGTTLAPIGQAGNDFSAFFSVGPANGLYLNLSTLGEDFAALVSGIRVTADDPANGVSIDATSNAITFLLETRPRAVDDYFLVNAEDEVTIPASIGVLLNDTDRDGDDISAALAVGAPGSPYFYDDNGNRVLDTSIAVELRPDGSFTLRFDLEALEDAGLGPGAAGVTYFEYLAIDEDDNASRVTEVEIAFNVGGDDDEEDDPNNPNLPGDGGAGGNNPNNPGGNDLPPGPGDQGGGNGESGAWGDIHATTFGGLKYDFQAIGEFVAARATAGEPFELQIRTGAWGATVSVTTAVATSIDGHKVSYDTLTNEMRIDDAVVAMVPNSSIALGGGAVHRGNGGNFAFTYADDRQVVYVYDRGNYIDYKIVATTDRVDEIVGLADSDSGQLVFPDGSLLPSNPTYAEYYGDAFSFANVWRITDAQSLFTYGAGESTATFTDTDFPPFAVSIADLPANLVAEATLRVDAAGITDAALRDAAILDLVLTGDPRMLTSSQQAVDPTASLTVQSTPLPKLVGIGADNVGAPEGNSGTTPFTFTVYRTNSVGVLSVDYAATTAGFNITAPVEADDFVGGALPEGTVDFADGESARTITIQIAGDTAIETNEQFAVALGAVSSPDFGLLQPSVMVLVEDDDAVKPTTARDQFAAEGDQAIIGNVLANDIANNGVELAARLVRLPENGTLTLSADGSFTYIPATGFAGTDSFLYRATDAFSSSTSQIVQLDITRLINTGPVIAAVSTPPEIAEAVDASAQLVTAAGTITINDPDVGDRLSVSAAAPVVLLNGAAVPDPLAAQIAALSAPSALRFGPAATSDGMPQVIAWSFQPGAAGLDFLAADDRLTITYQVRASDGATTSPAQPLIITIMGTAEQSAPSLTGPVTAAAAEDSGVTTVDLLAGASDADGDPLVVADLTGLVAGLTVDGNTLSVDTGDAAFQSLAAGAERNIVLEYDVVDGRGGVAAQTATVTIAGTNDTAAISGSSTGAVVEDGTLTAGGLLSVADPDSGEAAFRAANAADLAGTYGTFTFDATTGAWSYALDNDSAAVQALGGADTRTETLTVASLDGTATQAVTVTVQGTEDVAPLMPVSISIADAPTLEESGDVGDTTLLFPITASGNFTGAVTLNVAIDGGAASLQQIDFTGGFASLAVAVANDGLANGPDNCLVTISDPVDTAGFDFTVVAATAAGSVIEDDASAGPNIINGSNKSDHLNGTAGADLITANRGTDYVNARGGDDSIRATINDGNDFYFGDGGNDTVDYSALTQGITVRMSELFGVGTGLVTGHQSGVDVLGSIENVIGTSAADVIVGNRFANRLEGSAGNDRLTGQGGSDTFVFKPGYGNDRITDFDANPRGGQDYIELSGFGITAADFSDRVAITDVGADTLVTIDNDPAQTIRLAGIGNARTVTIDDFWLA